MLLIKTYIEHSLIHGMGVFAAEAVSKGTLVWQYQEGFDPVFPESALFEGHERMRQYLKWHAYPHHNDPSKIMLDGDDCRYMNHSDTPNVTFPRGEITGFALRDIAAGEELSCNYNEFAFGWYDI